MKKIIIPLIIFLILTIVMTYPLVFKMRTHIPGFFSTDEVFGTLWDYWRVNYSQQHNLSLRYCSLVAAPFGHDMGATGVSYFLYETVRNFSVKSISGVLFYNLQIFFNLILSSLCAFLLVFFISKSRMVALFSAIIFAFCPYQFVRSWQHLSLTYNELIPLALLAFILLRENFSKTNIAIAVFSILFLFSFDYSIVYLTMISLLFFSAYVLFYDRKNNVTYLKGLIFVGIISSVILSPQLFGIFKNVLHPHSIATTSAMIYKKSFSDLFLQSARPLSYLLPPVTHPVFGSFTEYFIGSQLYGQSLTEHALYLGWFPIILAIVAVRERRKRGKVNFYIGFFSSLVVIAWLFSQPPWWQMGPVRIFMPSSLMYKIFPMFRAYCRFGIVVMLSVAVLAGFGLKSILERFKTQKVKIAVASLFCGLVLFEFWNWPPFKVIDVSQVPEVYYWLKKQPGNFVVAEYPLDINGSNEIYKFYQSVHEKRIINGTIPPTCANKVSRAITELSSPRTAQSLKWMDVKYAIVHREDYENTEQVEALQELNKIVKNNNLKLVKSFPVQHCPDKDTMCVKKTGPIDVYEVVAAEPLEPKPR